MSGIYNDEEKELMKITAKSKNKSRLQELIDFAKISGFKKLGIANCLSVQKYADVLKSKLEGAGFEVVTINCRDSGLDGCVIDDKMAGACCDPVAQAEFLNNQKTELNIEVGLCLGHGILFKKHSNVSVTTFLVKDFVCQHNVVAELVEE